MDNKLSELSKPVMYVVRTLDGSVASVKVHNYTAPKGFTSAPLYSQEYVSALLQRIDELEVAEIKPEGLKLMIEAIGAHGYIVGCLVQGRPDLALEESRKWANAFSQAAEQSNG
ncbi:Uncharacterised protein [Serratia proteamaculans]|uniref:hypothetical protein n=1 Tax=Serratia proteamaculans TaxID=28151 RepID=UPI00217C7356|nr:hypothetical protein [Serratia proteamaculans]CAI1705100.1 Uncharacterised protein [Serratia proteamaculans]